MQQKVSTLEELYTASRYLYYNAQLGNSIDEQCIKISKSLQQHKFAWLDYQFSLAEFLLSKANFKEARFVIDRNIEACEKLGSSYFRALALLQILELLLATDQQDCSDFISFMTQLEISLLDSNCSRLKAQFLLIKAASEYRAGNFDRAIQFIFKASCNK